MKGKGNRNNIKIHINEIIKGNNYKIALYLHKDTR